MFMITATPGSIADVQTRLKGLCDGQGLLLHSFADLRNRLDTLLRVIACLWGLLSLGLVVSAFSIANTLTINVLEQTRETGLAALRGGHDQPTGAQDDRRPGGDPGDDRIDHRCDRR